MARTVVIKRNPIVIIRNFLAMQLAGYAAFIGLGALADYGTIYAGLPLTNIISYQVLYVLFIALGELALTLLIFFDWFYTHYTITSDAIVIAERLFRRRKTPIALSDIERADSSYTLLGRIFAYGVLVLKLRSGEPLRLRFVPSPERYAKLIERQKAVLERRAGITFVTDPTLLLGQDEHEHLEFKSTMRWDLKAATANRALEKMVMKTVAAFLNSGGGQLVIGVDDGRAVLGLEHDYRTLTKGDRDGFENHFTHVFNAMIGAEFRQFVKLNFAQADGKDVCIVNVMPATHPVFAKLDNNTEEFFVRTGNSTTPLKLSEAAAYLELWRKRG